MLIVSTVNFQEKIIFAFINNLRNNSWSLLWRCIINKSRVNGFTTYEQYSTHFTKSEFWLSAHSLKSKFSSSTCSDFVLKIINFWCVTFSLHLVCVACCRSLLYAHLLPILSPSWPHLLAAKTGCKKGAGQVRWSDGHDSSSKWPLLCFDHHLHYNCPIKYTSVALHTYTILFIYMHSNFDVMDLLTRISKFDWSDYHRNVTFVIFYFILCFIHFITHVFL